MEKTPGGRTQNPINRPYAIVEAVFCLAIFRIDPQVLRKTAYSAALLRNFMSFFNAASQ